ncbi:MAG: redoxin domain-containing protein [Acidobacteria bacterium]|nr:redoxin domain-containing protein [Acidobacteriota bacterium]
MRMTRRGVLAGLGALGAIPSAQAAIAVGDKAPDFELAGTNGKMEKLSAYRGKKNVVTAFYPKAFTGG